MKTAAVDFSYVGEGITLKEIFITVMYLLFLILSHFIKLHYFIIYNLPIIGK